MIFSCEAANDGQVEIPRFNYKGYKAFDDSGLRYAISDGDNNCISVGIPGGFSGEITVDFYEPFYWRIAEIISAFSAVVLIILGLLHKNKKLGVARVDE